jgi:endonuclease/exonuclease/phosphatase (EEP) superfamily protein YafD
METGKLIDSERGFGFCPTWPSIRLFPRMTIDHCLVNVDFRVLDRKVERDIGSDHLPVFVRLALIGQDGAGKLPNIAGRDELMQFGK